MSFLISSMTVQKIEGILNSHLPFVNLTKYMHKNKTKNGEETSSGNFYTIFNGGWAVLKAMSYFKWFLKCAHPVFPTTLQFLIRASELSTTVVGGAFSTHPYKKLFRDQFDPIFYIGRGGGPKYHWKFFWK